MAALDLSFGVIAFFAVLSLAASIVNGGLGYGYSSLSTPLALLVFANRIVNPAYVLLEAGINTLMLFRSGGSNVRATYRRALPVVISLVPGVVLGSVVVSEVAPEWVRFGVYATILPLILLQAAGFRRPLKGETSAAVPVGVGVGLMYSITTISGPPIALFWNNQGLKPREFKAAVAQVRIAESYLACLSYYLLGLFGAQSLSLFKVIAPPVLVGVPVGMFVATMVAAETFRRVCMAFDAGIVGYGLSVVLPTLLGVGAAVAQSLFVAVLAVDAGLLYRYLKERPGVAAGATGALDPGGGLAGGSTPDAGEGDPHPGPETYS